MTILKSAAIAAGFASSAFGQATSPIVGYTTTTIASEFADGSPSITLVAPTFVNSALFSGSVTSVAANGAVTLDGAAFTVGEFNELAATGSIPIQPTHYLETADGFWANIVSNGDGSVTLDTTDSSQLTSADSVVIRKHITIVQFFGEDNSAGLTATFGSIVTADNIILIGESGNLTFFADTSGITTDTYSNSILQGADNVAIQPDQGLQVLRRSGGETSLVFAGNLDENNRQVTVGTGLSILPVVLPTDTVLSDLTSLVGSLNGVDGLTPIGPGGTGITLADRIQLLIDGNTVTFFANNTGVVPGTFIDSTFNNSDAFVIPNGAAIVINRNGPPFTWTIPAPVVVE